VQVRHTLIVLSLLVALLFIDGAFALSCPLLSTSPQVGNRVVLLENQSFQLQLVGPFTSFGMTSINQTFSSARIDSHGNFSLLSLDGEKN
jgi:hypothetical protein